MNEIKNWLKDFGLNDSQVDIYLSIAGQPECKVTDIQRQTGLVRTSIYYNLGQLKSSGLVSENMQNNVRTFRAANIENLKQNIELEIGEEKRKLETLEKLKPIFDKLTSSGTAAETFVSKFEGTNSVKQAIEQAFRCNTKRWHVIASRDNFLFHTSKQYQNYYLNERKRRGIISKTLWEPVDEFEVTTLEDAFYRNPRKLPKEFLGTFKALVILYDDVTLVVDPYEQKTAYAIHDETTTGLLRLMFEALWSAAASQK